MGSTAELHSQSSKSASLQQEAPACTLSTATQPQLRPLPLCSALLSSPLQAFLAEVPAGSGESETESAPGSGFCAVGFALSFWAYSTWKGRCLYLEDLFVLPQHRGLGLGLALMCRCVMLAHAAQCRRVMWQALDWNTPAISFYTHKLGAVLMGDWLSLRLTQDGIADFRHKFAPIIAQLAAQEAEQSSGTAAAATLALRTPMKDVGQQGSAVEQSGAVAGIP